MAIIGGSTLFSPIFLAVEKLPIDMIYNDLPVAGHRSELMTFHSYAMLTYQGAWVIYDDYNLDCYYSYII